MARRNFDTEYFKKPFVRGLSGAHKLFYIYVISDSDHAGIWIPDFEIAQVYMGMKIDKEEVLKAFGNRIIQLSDGKWFFPEIIKKQYPNGLEGDNNAVKSAREKLEKYGITPEELKKVFSGVGQGLNNPKPTHIENEIEGEDETENETKPQKSNQIHLTPTEELEEQKAYAFIEPSGEVFKEMTPKQKKLLREQLQIAAAVEMPFTSQEFRTAFYDWLEHRVLISRPYKNAKSMGMIFTGENTKFTEPEMISAMRHSIQNEYQGLFPKKSNTKADGKEFIKATSDFLRSNDPDFDSY